MLYGACGLYPGTQSGTLERQRLRVESQLEREFAHRTASFQRSMPTLVSPSSSRNTTARACEAAYGSQSFHRDRYARIQGY